MSFSPGVHSQDVFQCCLEKSWEKQLKSLVFDNAMMKTLRAQKFFPCLVWLRCFSETVFSYRSVTPVCSSPQSLLSTFHRRISAFLSAHWSARRGSKPQGCWCPGWLLFSWGFSMDNFTVQKLLNNHWVVEESGEKSLCFHWWGTVPSLWAMQTWLLCLHEHCNHGDVWQWGRFAFSLCEKNARLKWSLIQGKTHPGS